jgi:acetolactate synthase-1/2/3 large subunit
MLALPSLIPVADTVPGIGRHAQGSDLIVAALENEGVDRTGVPGRKISTWSKSALPRLVLTRHEQGRVHGRTYGRLTGKPGLHHDARPGALNLTTGAAYALLGAMPMVMITGQKGIMTSRQAGFQIVDVVTAFKPLTKMARQIVSTATIPTLVRDAFRIAVEERPGPVLLELPEDIAREEAEAVAMVPPHPIEIPATICSIVPPK